MKRVAAALSVCLFWGSGWLFIKLGVSSFPPILFAGVRGTLAGIVLLAFARHQGVAWPTKTELLPMIIAGILLTGVSNGITFWGEQRISSSLAALTWCSMPFFTAAWSHILLNDQKLNSGRVAGLLCGFFGVWLVLSTQQLDLGTGAAIGKLAIVISAVIWALALVLNKRWLPNANSIMMTAVQMGAGGIVLLPFGLATESLSGIQLTPQSIGVFLMMLFGQGIVAYLAYYFLLSQVSATSVSMLSFVTPSIAVVLGVVLLGETPYWQMGAGLLAVAIGIITVNVLGQRRLAPA